MENIITIFKEKKLKLTPQRLAVYQYLKNTTEHPSAETIYNSLHINYPTMSLSTVYKALKTLCEVDLIQELNIGESTFRYDANIHEHAHVHCSKCGKVDDIYNLDYKNLNKIVEENYNYNIELNKLFFFGVCSFCQ